MQSRRRAKPTAAHGKHSPPSILPRYKQEKEDRLGDAPSNVEPRKLEVFALVVALLFAVAVVSRIAVQVSVGQGVVTPVPATAYAKTAAFSTFEQDGAKIQSAKASGEVETPTRATTKAVSTSVADGSVGNGGGDSAGNSVSEGQPPPAVAKVESESTKSSSITAMPLVTTKVSKGRAVGTQALTATRPGKAKPASSGVNTDPSTSFPVAGKSCELPGWDDCEIPGFKYVDHSDVVGADMDCTIDECKGTDGHGPFTLRTAARLCAKMPKCKAFVIKGHKYDWKHEYIIFFKQEEAPPKKNPSMGMFVLQKREARKYEREGEWAELERPQAQAAAMAQVPRELLSDGAPDQTVGQAVARLGIGSGSCSSDRECRALGRGAVCLSLISECYRLTPPYDVRQHLLSRRAAPSSRLKHYIDGFVFNNEFDVLDVRLFELYPVVDFFVIVEAPYTFQNTPKPIHFDQAKKEGRYKRYMDKIIHIILPKEYKLQNKDGTGKLDQWEIEVFCRDSIVKKGISRVREKLPSLSDADLYSVLDVDEIPRREVVAFLREFDGFPQIINMETVFTTHGFMWYNPPPANPWLTMGAAITTVGVFESKGSLGNEFRAGHFGLPVWQFPSAGWHCSWCFDQASYFVKMKSYSHSEILKEPGALEKDTVKKMRCTGSFLGDPKHATRHPLFDTSPLAKASKALHLTPTPNVGITWFNAMLPRLMQGKNRPARLDYLVDLSPECDFPAAEGMEKGKEEEK